jgi:biotin carboxyl carrier protein
MRTYLIDADKNEIIIDLKNTIKHRSDLIEFHYSAVTDNKVVNEEKVFIRKLAGNYFSSLNGKAWKKMARQDIPSKLLNVDSVFDLYRGYKPSGLTSGEEGEFLTQMPGKVVKINVIEGQKINKGETLLILEAMKMENEIKTGMDGIIKKIHVQEGDTLESGVLMLELESET